MWHTVSCGEFKQSETIIPCLPKQDIQNPLFLLIQFTQLPSHHHIWCWYDMSGQPTDCQCLPFLTAIIVFKIHILLVHDPELPTLYDFQLWIQFSSYTLIYTHYFIYFTVQWFHIIWCKHLHNHFTSKFTDYAAYLQIFMHPTF